MLSHMGAQEMGPNCYQLLQQRRQSLSFFNKERWSSESKEPGFQFAVCGYVWHYAWVENAVGNILFICFLFLNITLPYGFVTLERKGKKEVSLGNYNVF